jgi:hypothetical protein
MDSLFWLADRRASALQLSFPSSAQSALVSIARRLGALCGYTSDDDTLTLSAESFLPFLAVVLIRVGVETKKLFQDRVQSAWILAVKIEIVGKRLQFRFRNRWRKTIICGA